MDILEIYSRDTYCNISCMKTLHSGPRPPPPVKMYMSLGDADGVFTYLLAYQFSTCQNHERLNTSTNPRERVIHIHDRRTGREIK